MAWPLSYVRDLGDSQRKHSTYTRYVWGGVLIATADAKNFAGITALRFLLGGIESLITPTFVLIVSVQGHSMTQIIIEAV